MAALRHHGFFKTQNFNGRQAYEGERASSCHMLSQSAKPLPRYGDFSIFKMAAVRHLGFLNLENFNGQHVGGSKYAYPYQICCDPSNVAEMW